jgi:hypothetical protein
MLFSKEYLLDLIHGEEGSVIHEEICDHDRWSVRYRIIFLENDKLYELFYNSPATEYQCEGSLDDEDDQIECNEVEPIKITGYKRIPLQGSPHY